jgi:hypothetical protein
MLTIAADYAGGGGGRGAGVSAWQNWRHYSGCSIVTGRQVGRSSAVSSSDRYRSPQYLQ